MTEQQLGLKLAQTVIARLFVGMGVNYAAQNRNAATEDSFAPFLAEWETEPRLVASALAMSRFPVFCDRTRKAMLEAYNDCYQSGFYGSADAYFDSETDERDMEYRELFTDFNTAGTEAGRRELYSANPSLFREIDRWTKADLNGGTLGGTYGRHCITARFEDGVLSLAYNPLSEDECGSLGKTERKDDIVLFERKCDFSDWPDNAEGIGKMELEAAGVIRSLEQDFSDAIRKRLELSDSESDEKAKAASPRM